MDSIRATVGGVQRNAPRREGASHMFETTGPPSAYVGKVRDDRARRRGEPHVENEPVSTRVRRGGESYILKTVRPLSME
eukprot:8291181-Pyramimonas_sp.AAC.1